MFHLANANPEKTAPKQLSAASIASQYPISLNSCRAWRAREKKPSASNNVAPKISAMGKWVAPPCKRDQKSESIAQPFRCDAASGERAIHHSQRVIAFDVIHLGDSEHRAQPL